MALSARPAWVKGAAAAALAAFLLVGLLYTQVLAESGEGRIAWRDLTAEVGPLRWERQRAEAIDSWRELAAVLRAAGGGGVSRLPALDFDRETAVLVAVGPRSSTGYRLRVLRVTERRDRVVVVLRERAPSLDEPVRPRLTFPYRLIALPRTGKRVQVELHGRP